MRGVIEAYMKDADLSRHVMQIHQGSFISALLMVMVTVSLTWSGGPFTCVEDGGSVVKACCWGKYRGGVLLEGGVRVMGVVEVCGKESTFTSLWFTVQLIAPVMKKKKKKRIKEEQHNRGIKRRQPLLLKVNADGLVHVDWGVATPKDRLYLLFRTWGFSSRVSVLQ